MSDEGLPELIDVNKPTSSTTKDESKNSDEFKPVVSKRKRREMSKMDTTTDENNNKEEDEDEIEIDETIDDEELDMLRNNQDDNLPVQRVKFPPIASEKLKDGKFEIRKVHVPPHRYNPLKDNWMKVYAPVVDHLKLQIRFNLKSRNVEIRVKNRRHSNKR